MIVDRVDKVDRALMARKRARLEVQRSVLVARQTRRSAIRTPVNLVWPFTAGMLLALRIRNTTKPVEVNGAGFRAVSGTVSSLFKAAMMWQSAKQIASKSESDKSAIDKLDSV